MQLRAGAAASLGTMESVRVSLAGSPTANGAVVLRRSVTTGNQPMPTADLRFRRTERISVEVPTTSTDAGTAQLLNRAGQTMPIPVTAAIRDDADGSRWRTAQLTLAPLAPGDYVVEQSAGIEKTLDRIPLLLKAEPNTALCAIPNRRRNSARTTRGVVRRPRSHTSQARPAFGQVFDLSRPSVAAVHRARDWSTDTTSIAMRRWPRRRRDRRDPGDRRVSPGRRNGLDTDRVRAGAISVEDYLGHAQARHRRLPPQPELAEKFRRYSRQSLALSEERLRQNPKNADAYYQVGAAFGCLASYIATVEGRVRDSLGPARRAYKAHQRVLSLDPRRKDAALIVGMTRHAVASLSAPLRLIAYLAGFDGNTTRGSAGGRSRAVRR